MPTPLTYIERSLLCHNPTAKRLYEIMESKSSNLALAADVTSIDRLIDIAEQLGPYLCVLKTHVDILTDFSFSSLQQLTYLAKKQGFLIFEDRKFADIGNTVKHQYEGGIYKISSWADIVNAHILPGPGIIEGLKAADHSKGRGLLLLAEMSSKGSLANGTYTQSAINMALEYSDFVIGFISQQKLVEDPRFIHMTPGVHLAKADDSLGQKYTSPEEIICNKRSDIIIVGRGIIEALNPVEEAQRYQKSGWEAYQKRLTLDF